MSIIHHNKKSSFCNQPLKCIDCIENLLQNNLKSISDFVLDKSLPETITRVRIEIPSNRSNVNEFFSFSGVETILLNVFETKERFIIQDLRNGDVLFRVFYQKDDYYTLPILMIDVFFLKILSPETIKVISDNLKTTLLVYTRGKGFVELHSVLSVNSVLEYFDTELLIGNSFFNQTDFPLLKSLTTERIDEMNYFLENPLLKVRMSEILNNPYLSLFDEKIHKKRWDK